ncbi:4-hydroxy-3-methylbut-2-enyl diphosphate reductase [Streptomyces sp. NPDC051555]|uniref:4-hydroxy-3-methylbut-2-enyl diphosphate reductase n=1 Tax=Streptomyces sp. NPDC051555 TaxID=3365657 RepID=UPI00378B1ED7
MDQPPAPRPTPPVRRTVLLASPRSFCAGVERAIEAVKAALQAAATEGAGRPVVYVRRQIVHNTYVVAQLEARGAVFVEDLDEVPERATVVFSAHGVAPAVWDQAAARGLGVIDATCPLVSKVHAEARRFAARGDTVVLIGHAGHEEVDGTLGQAPNALVLVENADDINSLDIPEGTPVSYLTQTTLAVDETREVIGALRKRFPLLKEPPSDDICYATTNRQNAVSAVLAEAGLLLVVGSANSSNSVRLVELAHRHGTPAHLVDGPQDIEPSWLTAVSTVAVTAGTSAPPDLVEAVLAAIAAHGPITVEERTLTTESVHFGLPGKARTS